MFQNLNIRWSIIIAFVIGAIYFIIPTYEYYSIINDPELNDLDVDYLREDALKLGLDLQGGLYIILELDLVINFVAPTLPSPIVPPASTASAHWLPPIQPKGLHHAKLLK